MNLFLKSQSLSCVELCKYFLCMINDQQLLAIACVCQYYSILKCLPTQLTKVPTVLLHDIVTSCKQLNIMLFMH